MRNIFPNLGERLRYLMDAKGIEKAPELAKEMSEDGGDVVDIKSATRSINLHLGGKPVTSLSGSWIKRYCDFFDCSADFLMGYINESTHEIASVAEYTGLSEDAIRILHYLHGILGAKPAKGAIPYIDLNQTKSINAKLVDTISDLIEDMQTEIDISRKDPEYPISSVFTILQDYIAADDVVAMMELKESPAVALGNKFSEKNKSVQPEVYRASELYRLVREKRLGNSLKRIVDKKNKERNNGEHKKEKR